LPRRGPSEKRSRRLGVELGLKGARAAAGKSGLQRRPYPPGQHGRRYRRPRSVYLQQLEEKQKARFFYGITESQFRRYVERSAAAGGETGSTLVRLLETRLDNVVHRLGLASTRAQARQLVSHGHVLVDGRRVDVPSYEVRPQQRIQLRGGSSAARIAEEALELSPGPPSWLAVEREELAGTVLRLPEREDVQVPFDERLVIEFYAR
jgi:small subunit ribosomal protein S4